MVRISDAAWRMQEKTDSRSQWSFSSVAIHLGIQTLISRTGKTRSSSVRMLQMSVSSRSGQLTGSTGALYFSDSCFAIAFASAVCGSIQLSRTAKGLPSSCNSVITRSSHSAYSARGRSVMLPSVVTTRPMVECSAMTFRVPTSAAILNGTSWSNQGVCTILGCSFSI